MERIQGSVPDCVCPLQIYDMSMSTADLWPKNDCSQIDTGGKMAPVHAPSLWPRGGSWKSVFGCACVCACPCATPIGHIGSDGPVSEGKNHLHSEEGGSTAMDRTQFEPLALATWYGAGRGRGDVSLQGLQRISAKF